MEIICTQCDGLGEERLSVENMHPTTNVANLRPIMANVIDPSGVYIGPRIVYYARTCRKCNGHGYIATGTSGVPLIGRAA